MAYTINYYANPNGKVESRVVIDGGAPGTFDMNTTVKDIVEKNGNAYLKPPLRVFGSGQYLLVRYVVVLPNDKDDTTVTGQVTITLSTSDTPVVVSVAYVDETQ